MSCRLLPAVAIAAAVALQGAPALSQADSISLPTLKGPIQTSVDQYPYDELQKVSDEDFAPAIPVLRANAHRLSTELLLELAHRVYPTDPAEATYWKEMAQARRAFDWARCPGVQPTPTDDQAIAPSLYMAPEPRLIAAALRRIVEEPGIWSDAPPTSRCGADAQVLPKERWPAIWEDVRRESRSRLENLESALNRLDPFGATEVSDRVVSYGWRGDGTLVLGEVEIPAFRNREADFSRINLAARSYSTTVAARGWRPDNPGTSYPAHKLELPDPSTRTWPRADTKGGELAITPGPRGKFGQDPDRLVLRLDGTERVLAVGALRPPAVSPDGCHAAYASGFRLLVVTLCR